jgi:hypothetical protein
MGTKPLRLCRAFYAEYLNGCSHAFKIAGADLFLCIADEVYWVDEVDKTIKRHQLPQPIYAQILTAVRINKTPPEAFNSHSTTPFR